MENSNEKYVYVHRAIVTRNSSPYATGPLSSLSCLSVCNVAVLWPNSGIDQDDHTRGPAAEKVLSLGAYSLRCRPKLSATHELIHTLQGNSDTIQQI